jgi:hypothetical protein
MSRSQSFILALTALGSLPSFAEDLPPVTPYRPSVSSPAQLPAPGQLELEIGGLAANPGTQQRDSLPYQLKLAFTNEWGILLGGEAYAAARDASGRRQQGVGDTNITFKRAFLVDDATAFGLEWTVKQPTAKESVGGSGQTDYTLNGIFSKDLGDIHMDLNLNGTRIGAAEDGTGRMQTGLSSAFSTPISEKWGATAELSGARRSGTPCVAQFLTALTYNPSKRMAIDFGVIRGLNKASPNWSLFSGIVVPLANLW